jgi:hypothetical protein
VRFAAWILVTVARLWGADPRIGEWRMVSSHTVVDLPIKLSITAAANGRSIHWLRSPRGPEFTAEFEGRDYPVQTPNYSQISLQQLDSHKTVAVRKANGRPPVNVELAASADGTELTVRFADTGRIDGVWDRDEKEIDARNLILGSWIYNHDKTEMRDPQASRLKIEAFGGNGARLVRTFEYAAQFAGKEYPVKHLANTTVTLNLLNDHTVEEVWKRDGNTSDVYSAAVRDGGRHLDLTRKSLIPTGEHLTQEMLFESFSKQ